VARHDGVRVHDQDVLAAGGRQAVVEGAGLVAGAVVAVDQRDVEAPPPVAGDEPPLQREDRRVGGVVEDLDLQAVPRVVEGGDVFQRALHQRLVVHRDLHGDHGVRVAGRVDVRPTPEVEEDQRQQVERVEADGERRCDG
jgi:hypothetical protein